MKYFDSIAHTHRKRRREGRSPGQSKVLKQGNKSFLASRWLGFLTKGRRNQSKPPWISPAFRVTACSLERWDEEGQAWDWERDWRSWVEVGVRDGGAVRRGGSVGGGREAALGPLMLWWRGAAPLLCQATGESSLQSTFGAPSTRWRRRRERVGRKAGEETALAYQCDFSLFLSRTGI